MAALSPTGREALKGRARQAGDPVRAQDGDFGAVMLHLLIDRQVLREFPLLAEAS